VFCPLGLALLNGLLLRNVERQTVWLLRTGERGKNEAKRLLS